MSQASAATVHELTEKRTFDMRLHDRTIKDMEMVSEWEGFAKLLHPSSGLYLVVLMNEKRIVTGSPGLIADLGITAPVIPAGLKDGETYIGIVYDADGKALHHLTLLSGEIEDASWNKATEWASKIGGLLPSRQEQRLLFEKAPGGFAARAYWSGEQHAADSHCAWCQDFGYGDQGYDQKSASLRARAVRRLPI
jgi:hypothetical protein